MSRVLVISDIHGMYDEFLKLLEECKYKSSEDDLYLLGDYVDRGPEPMKVIQKVMELVEGGAYALMGNHEAMFLQIIDEMEHGELSLESLVSDKNGAYVTITKFYELEPEERYKLIEFVAGLKLKVRPVKLPGYIFVHAGYDPDVEYEKQSPVYLLWARENFINKFMWPDQRIVFGHTPTSWNDFKIWHGHNKIGIDCGAVYEKKLACLEFKDGIEKEYYV